MSYLAGEPHASYIVVIGDGGESYAHVGPFPSADAADAWIIKRGATLPKDCPPAHKRMVYDPAWVESHWKIDDENLAK